MLPRCAWTSVASESEVLQRVGHGLRHDLGLVRHSAPQLSDCPSEQHHIFEIPLRHAAPARPAHEPNHRFRQLHGIAQKIRFQPEADMGKAATLSRNASTTDGEHQPRTIQPGCLVMVSCPRKEACEASRWRAEQPSAFASSVSAEAPERLDSPRELDDGALNSTLAELHYTKQAQSEKSSMKSGLRRVSKPQICDKSRFKNKTLCRGSKVNVESPPIAKGGFFLSSGALPLQRDGLDDFA